VHRFHCSLAILIALLGLRTTDCLAQSAQPLTNDRHAAFERELKEIQALADQHPRRLTPEWADVSLFTKGLLWALRYDHEFTPADVQLLEMAMRRSRERLAALTAQQQPWATRHGKVVLAYISVVDGSVQPYGVCIPRNYDVNTPIRLDVVLHGSSRPVGMSELRFISRFDDGDLENPSAPDQPFIELHPLGRVENCYRWSGETDVFEAIGDVCRRYNIDRDRIVLRGMSMGASGTWHLGLKHPDRFVALGPYCGYVDTHKFSETPVPGFVLVGPLPDYQELGLHMLDSVDYAANAGVVPAIGCIGDQDVFFQAHVLMGEAMQREGLKMTNLISKGTGHVIDPVTHAEQMRLIAEHVSAGRRTPHELRFVTWTLKYNRCHWLEVLGLDQHYARAEISAKLRADTLVVDEPRNISRFAIVTSGLPSAPKSLQVGTSTISLTASAGGTSDRIELARYDGQWRAETESDSELAPSSTIKKRPGVQGPIDDAFTSPFICVRGTGEPWNRGVKTYTDASLQRFADEWHHYFRGELPVKNDVDVTEDDVRTRNLILFGDPGSNRWIAKTLPHLPLTWSPDSLHFRGEQYAAANHVPALIAPNPLPGSGNHYVVLNSGHTFRESDLARFNYLLFPHWGDWAVLKLNLTSPAAPIEDRVLSAGYFNESWR
jgi:pimeloyl-ACP methyl ester carboxylesterase